jgi:hypothetical protein
LIAYGIVGGTEIVPDTRGGRRVKVVQIPTTSGACDPVEGSRSAPSVVPAGLGAGSKMDSR